MPGSNVDFLFALFETQRLLRLYAEKQARRFGLTRAQWGVLAKLERTEGLKQAEIADLLEIQPITLTRLIDKLCDLGLIERRSDDSDRRVNRLYLTEAARPLMLKLTGLRNELTQTALAGLSAADTHRLVAQLETVKNNVREAVQNPVSAPTTPPALKEEPTYG
jgi:MarR family transcriptional regulator for hemolysin